MAVPVQQPLRPSLANLAAYGTGWAKGSRGDPAHTEAGRGRPDHVAQSGVPQRWSPRSRHPWWHGPRW
jgi:hypothetical protein